MLGRPSIHAKSSQKVLHYMLSQQDLVVKAWRSRIYSYSSATWLKLTGAPLIDWINETPHLHKLRVRCLQKLTDEGDLYELIGTAIIDFMKKKSLPFPHAMFSQRHFWEIKSWKRAMIFVFLLRVVLVLKTPKQWKKYNVVDYKFNVRSFRLPFLLASYTYPLICLLTVIFLVIYLFCSFYRLYMRRDREIIERSPLFQQLPADLVVTPVKRRNKSVTTSPSASEAPVTTFAVHTDSESE